MILVINTIERNKIELGLFDGKNLPAGRQVLHCFEFITENQSEDILPALDGILNKNKISLKDVSAILVHQGPGSYTGVRVGVTIANTLAWSLDIPVLGYQENNLDKIFLKAKKQHHFKGLVLPSYYVKV